MAGQDVDPQLRDSYMPHILSGKARFFKIHGKALLGAPGALLQASPAHDLEAKLRVVVLDLMKVKLKIQRKTLQPNGTTCGEFGITVLRGNHGPSTAAHDGAGSRRAIRAFQTDQELPITGSGEGPDKVSPQKIIDFESGRKALEKARLEKEQSCARLVERSRFRGRLPDDWLEFLLTLTLFFALLLGLYVGLIAS
jgi:hypothetical protein